MLTITRALARQLRTVFRRALNLPTRGPGPPVSFRASEKELLVRCHIPGAAVEFREGGQHSPGELTVPFQLLADCQARRNDPVTFEPGGKRQVVARWEEAGVPQESRQDIPKIADQGQFPEVPKKMSDNGPELLTALHDAMETTDREAIRYATDQIRLEGASGRIAATDGRQILVQSGFQFPFRDIFLIPRTSIFGCRELPQDANVAVGRSDDSVSFQVGPWTFHYAVDEDGRYPKLDSFLSDPQTAEAGCRISEKDANFLLRTLEGLPTDDAVNMPVTLDLDGKPTIRAVGEGRKQPTELVLESSEVTGKPLRISTNRKYLQRAVALGFRELCVFGTEDPVVCHQQNRWYVWALLGANDVIKPMKNAVRLTSGSQPPAQKPKRRSPNKQVADQSPEISTEPVNPRRSSIMPSTKTSQNGHANGKPNREPDQAGIDALITRAEVFKTTLRDAVTKTNDLIAQLKRHKKQAKTIQSTLATLRQLDSLEV